jgi:hypothetical protein
VVRKELQEKHAECLELRAQVEQQAAGLVALTHSHQTAAKEAEEERERERAQHTAMLAQVKHQP